MLDTIMCGRGVIGNPGLIEILESDRGLSKKKLYNFHNNIYEEYQKISSGDRNVLFKMKELWFYMISLFETAEKYGKKIKKAEKLSVYEAVVRNLFDECELRME